MSYEGYVQCLCTNGCYWTVGPWDRDEECLCPTCRIDPVWRNSVNTTNCDDIGFIEMSQFQVALDTYRVPTEEETKNARMYYDDRFSEMIHLVATETPEHKARVEVWEAAYREREACKKRSEMKAKRRGE